MGRFRLSLLLVLVVACTPVVAPAPSASPRASATLAPGPTFAPSGTPLPTPTPAARASSRPGEISRANIPTPRPALGLPIVDLPCSEWPSDVATVMTSLTLPPSICFVRTTAASVGTLACTVVGCVPITQGCADQGHCLQVMDGTAPHYVLVYIHPPTSLPAPVAETASITRVLCSLHQYRSVLDITIPGVPLPSAGWLATLEGREFQSAFSSFTTAYPQDAQRWKPASSDVENYADVCTAWYYPAARDQKVSDYSLLATFATKWLPR